MTALRIDMKKFKAMCEDVRYKWENRTAEHVALDERRGVTIIDRYRIERVDADLAVKTTPLWMQPAATIDNADELRSELRVAAQAAQQFGATPAQIDYIVALATKNGNFNVFSGGRLSKTEASRIIDVMKNGL